MIRIFTSLLLALTLMATSHSMAAARGAAVATGQMVLCTGSGPVAVYMDAQGQPTSAPHICPDAALVAVDGFVGDHPSAPVAVLRYVLASPARSGQVLVQVTQVPHSRGPPLFV